MPRLCGLSDSLLPGAVQSTTRGNRMPVSLRQVNSPRYMRIDNHRIVCVGECQFGCCVVHSGSHHGGIYV